MVLTTGALQSCFTDEEYDQLLSLLPDVDKRPAASEAAAARPSCGPALPSGTAEAASGAPAARLPTIAITVPDDVDATHTGDAAVAVQCASQETLRTPTGEQTDALSATSTGTLPSSAGGRRPMRCPIDFPSLLSSPSYIAALHEFQRRLARGDYDPNVQWRVLSSKRKQSRPTKMRASRSSDSAPADAVGSAQLDTSSLGECASQQADAGPVSASSEAEKDAEAPPVAAASDATAGQDAASLITAADGTAGGGGIDASKA